MGEFAEAVQNRMEETLAATRPQVEWTTEHYVDGTPVDVAGFDEPDRLVLVELEWRRADPADNTAKIFRHLSAGTLDDYEQVVVSQVFTGYYDLASGGISSKRKNAEFVGRVAADTFENLTYWPVDFELTPPKRGGDRPSEWKSVADEVARDVAKSL